MRDRRIVSSAVTSSALFLSMGIAHSLGGAIPSASPSSFIIWAVGFLLLQKVDLHKIPNSALAALVLLFQMLGHFSLSSSSSASTIRMSFSHIFCGLLSFVVIRFGLKALSVLEKGLVLFLTRSLKTIAISAQIKSKFSWPSSPDFLTAFIQSANQLRAPPSLATSR